MSVSKDLVDIIKGSDDKGTKPYDTSATVTRVDGSTVWVHIPGGVDETPVKKTINAKAGDTVQVRVSGGSAWLNGNASAPPTDDAQANLAVEYALVAGNAADSAVKSANIASEAAADAKATADSVHGIATQALADAATAKDAADNASDYAARALGNLSTVQSVTETLTWITAHGTMTLTTDVALDPTHVYFVVDAGGDYTVGGVTYAIVTEPDVADIGTYYELTIDESLNNYVGTHLALTSEGLWLLPASSGTNKVLIATGAGSVYTTAGTYIIDSDGTTVLASFRVDGTTIGIDDGTESYQTQDYHSLQMIDKEGNTFFWVSDLRDQSGLLEVTDKLVGNGTSRQFLASFPPYGGTANVTINGIATSAYTRSGNSYTFTTAPANGAEVLINYHTSEEDTKAYTAGIRMSGTDVGPMSFASGFWTEASGHYAEAHNLGTVARGRAQTALGLFNVVDDHVSTEANGAGQYALIIGNGSHDNDRSNAFAVDWYGDVFMALDTTASPGTTDGDLYAAITALSWQSDVIV